MIFRLLGGVVVLVLAAVWAILEVFYLPSRIGSIPVPLSIAAAVAGNVAFTRAMYAISSSVWAALLPGAVWLGVIARSAIARPEGDLLITGGSAATGSSLLNLTFLLLGSLALAFSVGTLRRPNRTQGTPATIGSQDSSPVGISSRSTVAAAQPPDTAGRR